MFTLDGFDFQGVDLDNLLRAGDPQGFVPEEVEQEEPQAAPRPANARPPPNADPRHKTSSGRTTGLTGGRAHMPSNILQSQVSNSLPSDEVPSGPIHQLWNQLFSGEAISHVLEQERPSEVANSDSLQTVPEPETGRSVTSSRRKTATTALPQVVRTQPPTREPSPVVVTTSRPDFDTVGRQPNTPEGPNFANFPAKEAEEEAGRSSSLDSQSAAASASKTRKRMRVKKKPRTETAAENPVVETDFVPTPPSAGKRGRLLAASVPASSSAEANFIPTPPPPTKRSRTQSKSSPPPRPSGLSEKPLTASSRSNQPLIGSSLESPRSSGGGGRGGDGNLIDLDEVAGVQELQEALRAKTEELRRLDQAKTQEIREEHFSSIAVCCGYLHKLTTVTKNFETA